MSFLRSRRLLGLVTAATLATTTLIAAGQPAQAEPTYRHVADYPFLRSVCVQVGDSGVQSGAWDAYQCRLQPVGLDVWWSLWVTP